MPFARIAATDWRLHERIGRNRRRKLIVPLSFEEIIRRISASAEFVAYVREHTRHQGRTVFRAKVTLQADPALIDLFHNSASGYRAQFYRDPQLGERANSYALQHLIPIAIERLDPEEQRWVERSLAADGAKTWIHQGKWLRQQARRERNLLVPRWTAFLGDADGTRRKHARWASLTPGDESRLELKGGYLTRTEVHVGSLKPNRADELHAYGFT